MQRKKLRLEEVRVESFETGTDGTGRGTVNAHDAALNTGLVKCGTNSPLRCETFKRTCPTGDCC